MKRLLMLIFVLVLALSACNQAAGESDESNTEENNGSEQESEDSSEEASEDAESEEVSNETDESNTEENESSENATVENQEDTAAIEKQQAYESLTDTDIVAMAIQDEFVSDISVTASELLNGSFEPTGPGPSTVEEVSQLVLTPEDYNTFPGMTKQQRVYRVSPAKANAVALMIVDSATNEIVVTGTQSFPTYEELRQIGAIYNIDQLFETYYGDPTFNETAARVVFSQ
jgi:flagellar motor protein MotB